jgi:hypothetical protein
LRVAAIGYPTTTRHPYDLGSSSAHIKEAKAFAAGMPSPDTRRDISLGVCRRMT